MTTREEIESLAQTVDQFAEIICPKLAEMLGPFGASAAGWEDAAAQLRKVAEILRERK